MIDKLPESLETVPERIARVNYEATQNALTIIKEVYKEYTENQVRNGGGGEGSRVNIPAEVISLNNHDNQGRIDILREEMGFDDDDDTIDDGRTGDDGLASNDGSSSDDELAGDDDGSSSDDEHSEQQNGGANISKNTVHKGLPMGRVKQIIKTDPDVNMVARDAVFVVTKATVNILLTK